MPTPEEKERLRQARASYNQGIADNDAARQRLEEQRASGAVDQDKYKLENARLDLTRYNLGRARDNAASSVFSPNQETSSFVDHFSSVPTNREQEQQVRDAVYNKYGGIGLGVRDFVMGVNRGLGLAPDVDGSAPWKPPTPEERKRYPYKNASDTGGSAPAATWQAASSPITREKLSDGRIRATWGKPGEEGSGSITYSAGAFKGGANIGYDPQEARQAQASPYYRQIGANTYLNDRGLMIQGNQADADYMYRFRHSGSSPVFFDAPQQQAQAQPQMPNYQPVGWKSKLAWNKALLDSADKAAQREMLREHYQGMDARAAEQLGFQQEQARQQMELAQAGLGLQAEQNAMNRTKAALEQQLGALGLKQQQGLFDARQEYLSALGSGDMEKAKAARMKIDAYGGDTEKKKAQVEMIERDGQKVPARLNDDGTYTVYEQSYTPEQLDWAEQYNRMPEDMKKMYDGLSEEGKAAYREKWKKARQNPGQ